VVDSQATEVAMNHADLEAVIKGIAPVIKDFSREQLGNLPEKLAGLERMSALEIRLAVVETKIGAGPDTKTAELEARVAGLEAKIVSQAATISRLEADNAEKCRFAGGFNRAVTYRRNDLVQFRGILWVCCRDYCQGETPAESGSGSWVMGMKHSPETMKQIPPSPRLVSESA